MLNRRQFLSASGAGAAILGGLALTGCGGSGGTGSGTTSTSAFKVTMVTDMGGVNDQSFNQGAWEGLDGLDKDEFDAKYIESKQEADYPTNLDKAVDGGAKLVWGIGFALAEAIVNTAKQNPDVTFANVDNSFGDDTLDNVCGVVFRAQEPSFVVGYIAALKTETGKLGFVGGQTSEVIDQFEWGFKAGVEYANKEKGTAVTVDAQYVENFTDAAKGKAIANKMFSDGVDIVFHAAGGAGVGAIEAAKEAGKFAIGVDMDQAHLAPDNVLTSALKNVSKAVQYVTKQVADGEEIGGTTEEFGLAEDMVGIPEEHTLMGDEIYQAALDLEATIKAGDITPPANEDDFNSFVSSL